MNRFQQLINALIRRRCQNCQGSGHCDDAEPGDIQFNSWQCPLCFGSGMQPSEAQNVPMAQFLGQAHVAELMMKQITLCDYEICGAPATKILQSGERAVSKFCDHCAETVVKQGRGRIVGTIEY